MFTAVALTAAELHPWHGGGFWFLLIPLFWILVIAALVAIFGRRRRAWLRAGYGPHAYGPHGHYDWQGWQHAQAAGSAESVLAQRYANGDIDEKEYRARLEVLRSSAPVPPPMK